jgi:hypothetical protein
MNFKRSTVSYGLRMRGILSSRLFFVVSLCLAGAALSQKGPPPVILSQTIQNNSKLMTLEWESWPGYVYAVETSDLLGGWTTIATDLKGPATSVGHITYPIPDQYLFESKRFFRVRLDRAN